VCRTNISVTVRPIGVKFCRIVDLSSRFRTSLGGDIFGYNQMRDRKRKVGQFLGL